MVDFQVLIELGTSFKTSRGYYGCLFRCHDGILLLQLSISLQFAEFHCNDAINASAQSCRINFLSQHSLFVRKLQKLQEENF